jgi:hypothetical protein
MSVTYPLTPPSQLRKAKIRWSQMTRVGVGESEFTYQPQVQVGAGQRWTVDVSTPPLSLADGEPIIAFLCALNGPEGTFYLGDSLNRASRGNLVGALLVGAGAVAGVSTLPLGHGEGGSGMPAAGDWLGLDDCLYKVVKVNTTVSVDVWPRLRLAHEEDTVITTTATRGVFRLAGPVPWESDGERRRYAPISFTANEVVVSPTTPPSS